MSRTTATRIAFATLAIAFFATPIAARMLGITAESFENRRFADPPKLSQGWDALGQTTRYLTDRMPLRAQAVRANTRIWTDVLGTDPVYKGQETLAGDQALPFAGRIESQGNRTSPPSRAGGDSPIDAQPATAVVTGRGGWVYYGYEFSGACAAKTADSVALRRFGELVHAIRTTSRDAVMFVVPDKSSAYPEHLPESYPFDHCAPKAKEQLWQRLENDGPSSGVIELRSELQRQKARYGDGLFQLQDTHWTTLGALTLVERSLESVSPLVRLKRAEIRKRKSVSYTGDLSAASGNPGIDERKEHRVVRESDAPRVPGRTLLLCDSFVYRWMRVFEPYFENVRYVSWYNEADTIAREIRRSDRVIVEIIETYFRGPVYSKLAASIARKIAVSRRSRTATSPR